MKRRRLAPSSGPASCLTITHTAAREFAHERRPAVWRRSAVLRAAARFAPVSAAGEHANESFAPRKSANAQARASLALSATTALLSRVRSTLGAPTREPIDRESGERDALRRSRTDPGDRCDRPSATCGRSSGSSPNNGANSSAPSNTRTQTTPARSRRRARISAPRSSSRRAASRRRAAACTDCSCSCWC